MRIAPRARRWALAVLATGALTLTGCSQIATLKVVAGDEIASVEIAIGDVLLENSVDVMVVPVCKLQGEQYDCKGSTVDKEPITGKTSGGERENLTVSVGDNQIYSGTVREVLDKAARAK